MAAPKKHGMVGHPAYRSWQGAKDRCQTKRGKAARIYGAKGIKMCPEWAQDFGCFWDAVGASWFPGATLDRLDANRGYEPGNVRWATKAEQSRNRACVPTVSTRWGDLTLPQAAEKIGLSPSAMWQRYRKGMRGPDLLAAPNWKGSRVTKLRKAA